jgi:hypothetical protein
MNFSKEELLRRLANGESIETIAQEVTEVLNEVAAEQEAAKMKEQKRADWLDAWNAIKVVIKNHYPKTTKYFMDAGMTANDENELLDALIQAADNVENEIDTLAAALMMGMGMKSATKAPSDDEILAQWIKSFS